jgi:hypothetical protein
MELLLHFLNCLSCFVVQFSIMVFQLFRVGGRSWKVNRCLPTNIVASVDFNLAQLFTANIFSIKEHKIYNGKYTHYIDIFPLETMQRI